MSSPSLLSFVSFNYSTIESLKGEGKKEQGREAASLYLTEPTLQFLPPAEWCQEVPDLQ